MNHYTTTKSKHRRQLAALGLTLGVALTPSAALSLRADDGAKLDKLEQENKDLKKRLDALETVAKAEGILPDGDKVSNPLLTRIAGTKIEGFVTGSYFYDTSTPPGQTSPGYLWNRKSGNFSLNKVKLTLASPAVERSGDTWGAGYRVSLVFGQDAPIVNSGSGITGFNSVREGYVELNAPVGTGLNIKVGELISLLNYESGDGGAANDNFSQGYQWFYTGNGPAAGAQLGYTFTDWLDAKVRVQNGLYAGPVDNNQGKTVMASIGLKPSATTWVNLVGSTGREAGPSSDINVASLLGGWAVTDKFHLGTELDYFWFETKNGTAPVWSTGAFASYSFTSVFGVALRGEFVSDARGVDASGDPLGFPVNTGNDLTSFAFTINIKPVPNVKIQPEVRFDHSSLPGAFGKHADRVILGLGVSYLF
jgi:hypothetical protein